LQTVDFECGGQVLVGLPNDQLAEPVLAPARFKGGEHETDHNEDEDNQIDQGTGQAEHNALTTRTWHPSLKC
jgi:hypothetical protein